MSLQNKKKHKTGIPVIKITPRNNDKNCESAAACHPEKKVQCQSESDSESRSESVQNLRNQGQQFVINTSSNTKNTNLSHSVMQHQLSNYSSISSKPVKKIKCPETWADEVIESHSQKLRNTSSSESKRRHDDMEKHLKEAEMQLITMGNLLEQREKMMKEAAEKAANETAELELKLLNQDGHLIKHGIDPVTGEQIVLDEEGEKKVEFSKKITKKKVQEMREKLKEMNSQAETYLSDIESTLQFLNNLESASDRFGQLSEGALTHLGQTYDHLGETILDENYHVLTDSEMANTVNDEPSTKEVQNEMLNVKFDVSNSGNSNIFDGLCENRIECKDMDNNKNGVSNDAS